MVITVETTVGYYTILGLTRIGHLVQREGKAQNQAMY